MATMSIFNNVNNNSNVMDNNNTESSVRINVSTQAKEVAWKGIKGSKNFTTPVTIDEAVEAVGADYEVKKEHLIRVPESLIESIKSGNPYMGLNLTKENIITSHMATVRSDNDKTLGVVGSKYGVVQNAKAFEFIDIITSGQLGGQQQPIIETAGILGDGERMFVTAKMPSKLFIEGDNVDGIDDYILFTNTHDGSGAVTVLFTPIRVICQNTLNAAIKNAANKLIFKHTSNVSKKLEWEREENMQRAVAVLEMHKKFKQNFIEQLYNLKEQRINENDALLFSSKIMASPAQVKLLQMANMNLDAVEEIGTRTKNNILALRDTIESGIGQANFKGTKLWLYNGLTTYLNNERKFKTDEDRFDSIALGGDANKKVQKGFDLLVA